MRENVVRHLRDNVGLDLGEIPGVYEIFLQTVSKCIADLRAASDPVDFRAIRAVTHTMMGFARNTGAADLGDAAHALNAAAHEADAEACLCGIHEIEALAETYRDNSQDDETPAP